MTYTLKNLQDTSYIAVAEPDAGDFAALAERNSGVIAGCAVTAQVTPALAVDITGGSVLVGGSAVAVSNGTVVIVAGEATPRFDLVVIDGTGTKLVIKGTANATPVFPLFDPTVFCWLAALYIRASVSSIVATDVIDKRISVQSAFKRVYADDVTVAISTTNSVTTKTFKMLSNGDHQWMSSVLRRTADAAMEFATSLVLKASDVAQSVLILRALSGTALQIAGQKLLDVQSNAGVTLASINGAGQLATDNYKYGVLNPNGNVLGNKGDIYVNRAFTTQDTAIWLKTIDGTNTGWISMGSYAPTQQALTTGAVYAWIGNPATPPAGSVYLNGQLLSSTLAANLPLLALIGNTYGGTPGTTFAVPDWRDVSPMGVGTTLLTLGAKKGAVTTTQTIAQLPVHNHLLHDSGHTHPLGDTPWVYAPPSAPTAFRAFPSNQPPVNNVPNLPYMLAGGPSTTSPQATGIVIDPVGTGAVMTTLSPVVGTHWLVRA